MVRLAENPDCGHWNRLQPSVSGSTTPSPAPTARPQKVPIRHRIQPPHQSKGFSEISAIRGGRQGLSPESKLLPLTAINIFHLKSQATPRWQRSLSAKFPSWHQSHEEIRVRSVAIKLNQTKSVKHIPNCQEMEWCRGLDFAGGGSLSATPQCHMYAPNLQNSTRKMPGGDISNGKQRRATQSSFRCNKTCFFPGWDLCCTF